MFVVCLNPFIRMCAFICLNIKMKNIMINLFFCCCFENRKQLTRKTFSISDKTWNIYLFPNNRTHDAIFVIYLLVLREKFCIKISLNFITNHISDSHIIKMYTQFTTITNHLHNSCIWHALLTRYCLPSIIIYQGINNANLIVVSSLLLRNANRLSWKSMGCQINISLDW